ncbi:MAG: G8 domain-containing protein, partial [Actinomycetota bacterium]|nr:G8 domain-containing protein [Actinomycetota bacterium]
MQMLHPSRREFLRQFGVTALTGAVVMSAGSRPLAWALGPAKSWSDLSAWPGGKVPGPGDVAAVGGAIVLERDALVAGVVIGPGGSLSFAPDRSVLLESTGNLVVEGQLSMRPSSSAAIHTLRFPDVNDSGFQGGGMDPLNSDVGLWVMGAGRLDLQGSPKQAWGYQSQGTGWQGGDELVATPVSPGDFDGFRSVALGGAVPSSYRAAEVLNLTRNVRLEGSSGGQSHVLIRSTAQQHIENVQLRYMGVGGTLGRYPLHFHHCMDGSRGSVVRGVVVRDSLNHAFVPHNSHGITFRDCIAYDITEDAYWWDPRVQGFLRLSRSEREDPENQEMPANDISWEGCVAALVRGDRVRLGGFRLGRGTGNRCVGCVAVGVQ